MLISDSISYYQLLILYTALCYCEYGCAFSHEENDISFSSLLTNNDVYLLVQIQTPETTFMKNGQVSPCLRDIRVSQRPEGV